VATSYGCDPLQPQHEAVVVTRSAVAELAARWRADADLLEGHGAAQAAATARRLADQLDAAIRADLDVALTLTEAARESGYSVDRLRHKVAAGELPNAGRKGSPRIRRADLPRRAPKRKAKSRTLDVSDAAGRLSR
jgi:hypothetical protein